MSTRPLDREPPTHAAKTPDDLEALRREIAHVKEERRLLLGRFHEPRLDERPTHGPLATYVSLGVSVLGIVGFVALVALNPPRVPPRRIVVPAPSLAPARDDVPAMVALVAPPAPRDLASGAPPTRRRERERDAHVRRDAPAGAAADVSLSGLDDDGTDPLGGLSDARRPRETSRRARP